MYLKNDTSPKPIYAILVNASDGSPITSGVTAYHIQGTTRTAGAGTLTHIANGRWCYVPTQAETNYDAFAIDFYHDDAVGKGALVEIVTANQGLAIITADTSAIKQKTDAYLDATISSRAPANTALSNTVWTDTKADFLDAAISSRLAASDYTPPDNASIASIKNTVDSKLDVNVASRAPASTALSNEIWTNAKAAYLDAAISSRLDASSYVAPDNTSISAIKTQTDKFQFDSNNYVYAVGIGGESGTDWTDTEKQQIRYRLGIDGATQAPSTNSPHLGSSYSTLDDLAAHVSTRLAASDYVAPDNSSIADIKAKTDKLTFDTNNYVYSVATNAITDWTDNEKKQIRYRLGIDGTTQAPSTNAPHLGSTYSTLDDLASHVSTRLAASDYVAPDNASIASIKSKTDAYLDAAVSSRLAASAYTPPDNASISSIKNTVDTKLDATISSRAPANTALSNTVWTDAKADFLDAAISSRLAASDYTPPDNASIASIKNTVDSKLDVNVASRAPASTALSNEIWTNAKAAYLDAAISSRLDASSYVAPDNTSISAIKTQTDKFQFDSNNYVYAVGIGGESGTDWTDTEKQQIRYRLGIDGATQAPSTNSPHLGSSYSTLDDLAAHVSTRLAASDYVAPDNSSIADIKAKTDKLTFDTNNYVYSVATNAITDWTDAEKQQIRYRLGIDGTTASPQSNTPHLGSTYSTLDDLAAHVSTRLAASDYTPPDNASIAAIKTKTDQLSFDTGKVLAKVSDPVTISSTDVSAIVDGVWDEPAAQHTTSGSTGAALNNAGSGSVDTGAIAQAVWQYTTRELTGFSFQVTVETNLDKIGYSLTSAYDRAKDALKYTEYTAPDNASISAIKTQTDKLAFAGNDVKATLDGEAVTVAINQDKIGYSLVSDYDRAKDALKYTEYTAPDNTDIIAILNQVNRIQFTPENYIRSAVTNPETIAQTIFTYDITKAENLAPAYSLTTLILGSLYMVTSNNTLTIYKSNGLPHLTRNLGIDPLDGHISAIRP